MDAVDLFAPDDAHEDDVHFRLSLDSDGEPESPLLVASLPPLVLPPLVLPSLEASGDHALLWNLISPCSEPPESPISVKMDDLTPAEGFQDVDLDERPEPEPEKTVGPVQDEVEKTAVSVTATVSVTNVQKKETEEEEEEEEEDVRYASCSDSDEEVEVFNVEKSSLRRRSSLDGKTLDGSEKLDSVTEADEMDEIDDVEVSSTTSSQMFFDDSTSEDGSVAGRPSYAAMGGKWVGRMKARTYSGSASMKMQQTYEKLRARTLSATSMVASTTMRRHGSMPAQDPDDGGFSSDDEDYDHDRASRASVSRQSSFSFPTARLSAVKNVKLPTSVSSLAMRFRSSSSGTTVSDDGSIVGNVSTLSGSTADSPTSSVSAPASYNTSTQDLKHKATACATRAAGILGAASAEAARKLKASRAFRSSPPASASQASFSMVAASPIVDNVECSPSDLPPARPQEQQNASSNVAAAASG